MELRWILAVGFEAAFWLMVVAFLVLRYRYGVRGITRAFVIGVVIDTAGIIALGVWDYVNTGHVNTYTAVVTALVVSSLTLGKRHFDVLDRWMSRRVKPKRGRQRADSRPLPERC
jgi:hypothetical protein